MPKDEFLSFLKSNPKIKKSLLQELNTYEDDFFRSLIAMLENAPLFREVSRTSLRRLSYLMK